MSRPRLIALLLALVTLAVYLPVARNGFILYDDGDYVTQNKMVQSGLTFAGVKWAFTSFFAANWHPLTWLSLMLDCELFGVNAAGTHLVNVLFHTANTVMLFALWLRLFQRKPERDKEPDGHAVWPAAFVAALFALHPLHVESVAWAAERKDVLSTFFGLLTLLCYARYIIIDGGRLSLAYWLGLFSFACGLMSKPMLVTLPFVMLLLDYWPLQRFKISMLRRLVPEKIPFFALTAASCVVTYFAQKTGAVRTLAEVPFPYRLENAAVSVVTYLSKILWPVNLAVIYPMPQSIPAATLGLSLLILAVISVVAWKLRKTGPYLLVGWFWFLGTLVPVLGLVKVGDAAMADRYTYFPSIGIFIAIAFSAPALLKSFRPPKFAPAAGIILAALTLVTEKQLAYWHDDESLFKHAIDVTRDNVDAVINYGVALENEGKPVAALAQYRRAEALGPSYMAHADCGNLLFYMGDTNGALEEFRDAVQLNPRSWTLHERLGIVLAAANQFSEATNEFYEAIRLAPANPSPRLDLGSAFAARGDFSMATNEFSEALRLDPSDPAPLVELARALLQQGRDAEAIDELHKALRLDPDNFQTLTFAARVLATDEHAQIRNGSDALAFAQKANALTDDTQPLVEDALGMAYAENGQFDDAQSAASNAISLATAAAMKPETIDGMKKRLALYGRHQPWRESFLDTNSDAR